MDNSAENAPLLNEYKLEYFARRFPQTVFGGLKFKTGLDLPMYIYFLQLVTFLLPLLIASILTIPAETKPELRITLSYVYGVVMFIMILLTHIILFAAERKTDKLNAEPKVFSPEDSDIEFRSCFSLLTVKFIVQKKKHFVNIFLHALIGGLLYGVIFQYLLPSRSEAAFGSHSGSIIYYVIAWITVCIGNYGLLAQTPPEPAQFGTTDHLELSPVMRPFYIGCFGIVGLIAIFEPAIKSADFVLRIIFPFLPFLWTLGMLPPLDSLYAWLGDQTVIHLLGGSSMANNARLLIMLILSATEVGIIYAVPNATASVGVAACIGLLLSLDVCSVMERLFFRLVKRAQETKTVGKSPHYFSLFRLLHLALMLVASALIACFIQETVAATKKSELIDIIGYVLIGCFVIMQLFGRILSIYLFFGLLQNPLFKILQNSRLQRSISLLRKLILNSVTPLLLVTFLALSWKQNGASTNFLVTLAACRAFRWAWQDTHQCLLDIVILMLVKYSGINEWTWWHGLDTYLQLLLVHLMRSRIQYLWNCLSFCLRYMIKFYLSSKVRHKSYKKVGLITLLLLPIWISLFLIAVILEAPLLPLFTLPLFFMGFPRPRRFWPNTDMPITTSSPDWIYYKQLTQPIINQLKDILSTGSLGDISTGNYYLARFQDRLIWISVLEKGYMHANIVIKGLELAETSCHTAEAARIDDIFEAVSNAKPRTCFNPYPTHVLTPCDFVKLNTYSDARNVLTGIIDRPENLNSLRKHFVNSLIWVLLRYCKVRRDSGLGDGPTMDDIKKKHEEKRKKYSFRPLLTNETHDTIVSNLVDDSNKSASLNSKSSVSENSMTALWNARNASVVEPIKMKPLKGQQTKLSGFPDTGLPALPVNRKNSRDSIDKPNFNFRGPNIVMDDDFDEFGFDEFDNSLPRSSSWASLDNANNTQPHLKKESFVSETDEIIKAYPVEQRKLTKKNTLPALSADVSSPHSAQIEPPTRWKDSIPVESSDIAPYDGLFSEDWFSHVISLMNFENKGERVMESIASDRGLLFIFRKLVLSCFYVFQEQQQYGALDVWRIFNGELPWSQYSHWLEQDTELRGQSLLAFRYAFKLMYDEAVLGSIDDFEELAETLLDYEENWHMGNDQDEAWAKAVLLNVPNLLSVGNDTDNGTFTSRVLTKQIMSVPIGKLDSENVRAIWAALSLELYYFTNDDEERYSIQAHPSHLRNITIQAADPPLGYPVYSSGLINIVAW